MLLSFPREFAKNPDYRTPPLAHQVPLATVRNNVYVLTDGSMVAVYRIRGMEYDLAGLQDTEVFTNGLGTVLNATPLGVQVKLLHRIHHNYLDLFRQYEEQQNGQNTYARYIAWTQYRRIYQMMERGDLLRNDNLLVLTYDPKIQWWEQENKVQAFLDSFAGQAGRDGVLQRTSEAYGQALQKFEDAIRPIANQMRLAGLSPDRLNDRQLYELAWEILNPRESLRRPCPEVVTPSAADPYAGLFATKEGREAAAKRPDLTVIAPISEREQLCASDWHVGDKWVRIDDMYYAAISLRMLPTHVYPSLALSLAGIPFECTIAIDAMTLAKQKELEKQWSEARSAESKAQATLFGATADPAEMAAAQEKRAAYLELTSSFQNPFRLRMVITVSAPSPQILNQRCDAVISLLRNMESAQGVRAHYDVDTLIKTTWPFSPITDINARKAYTSHIAKLMPVFSRWEGSQRPVTLLLDQMQRVVKHDPFPYNQHNRNKTLCGKSGSGKSFATQLADVQPHAARANTEILIVESGGSFELTTELFGGKFIKLGPSSPYQINPFDLPPGFDTMAPDQQEIELRYKYGFIKNLCLAMARLHDPESQMLAENVVGQIAQRTYQSTSKPRFRDFYRILGEYRNRDDKKAEELAGRLRTLLANYVVTEAGEAGIYSHYFDCYTNFDARLPIICFDLIDVKNDPALLVPTTMVVILGLIYNRLMLRDGTERVVIIDEAWALIKDGPNGEQSPAGQGIELFWREGRKLGASSAMISQNFSDMAGDKVGRAVVGNSPIQYFLVHERLKANDDAFRSSNFSKEKLDRVYSLKTVYGEYSEILIKEGEEWGVVRLPSSGPAYWLATTDPKDLDLRRRYWKTYKAGYGLSDQAIIAILAEDYPGGFHAAQGKEVREMPEQEALQFAERWQDHYRRFSDLVAQGKSVPPNFE